MGKLPGRGTDPAAVAGDMKVARLKTGTSLAVAIAALLVAGCAGLPKDGRYQTGGGGWDNFRAEAPAGQAVQA